MVVNGLCYGQCVCFGAHVLEVQLHFERQNAQAIWECPLPYCHRALPGANATARMRRVQPELCLSRAGSDNKRLLDVVTGMVWSAHACKHSEHAGLQPGQKHHSTFGNASVRTASYIQAIISRTL
jgi:hypothetical protein